MNIAHIVPNLEVGGLQTFTIDLAGKQILAGHKVTIITLMNTNNNDLIDKCDLRIDIINLKSSTNFYNIKLMFKVYKIISSNDFSILHTHGIALYFSLMSSLFKQNENFIHTVHNLSQNEAGKVRRLLARFSYQFGLAFPVTISNEVSESFKKFYPKTLFRQINNGLSLISNTSDDDKDSAKHDLNELKLNVDTKVYVSVGRIDYQKNRSMLLDAFYEFSSQRNIVLAIIGGPIETANPYYAPLLEHPAVKENKVHFLGLKHNVPDYLDCSDYFCSTSLFEGLPISVLEAMRAGLICICTPAGGTKSLLKDVGYISRGFSADDFVNALIDSENNLKSITPQRVKDHFKNKWDMDSCAASYLNLYRELS